MKQEITFKMEIPEGWEFDRFGRCKERELYYDRSGWSTWTDERDSFENYIIIRKKPVKLLAEYGDLYWTARTEGVSRDSHGDLRTDNARVKHKNAYLNREHAEELSKILRQAAEDYYQKLLKENGQ